MRRQGRVAVSERVAADWVGGQKELQALYIRAGVADPVPHVTAADPPRIRGDANGGAHHRAEGVRAVPVIVKRGRAPAPGVVPVGIVLRCVAIPSPVAAPELGMLPIITRIVPGDGDVLPRHAQFPNLLGIYGVYPPRDLVDRGDRVEAAWPPAVRIAPDVWVADHRCHIRPASKCRHAARGPVHPDQVGQIVGPVRYAHSVQLGTDRGLALARGRQQQRVNQAQALVPVGDAGKRGQIGLFLQNDQVSVVGEAGSAKNEVGAGRGRPGQGDGEERAYPRADGQARNPVWQHAPDEQQQRQAPGHQRRVEPNGQVGQFDLVQSWIHKQAWNGKVEGMKDDGRPYAGPAASQRVLGRSRPEFGAQQGEAEGRERREQRQAGAVAALRHHNRHLEPQVEQPAHQRRDPAPAGDGQQQAEHQSPPQPFGQQCGDQRLKEDGQALVDISQGAKHPPGPQSKRRRRQSPTQRAGATQSHLGPSLQQAARPAGQPASQEQQKGKADE